MEDGMKITAFAARNVVNVLSVIFINYCLWAVHGRSWL